MEVRASPDVVDFIGAHGGKVFVWSRSARCCRGTTTFLEASTERDHGRAFRRVRAEGIELFVDLPRLPALLEIDVRGRWRRTIRAYWDGCAWVT